MLAGNYRLAVLVPFEIIWQNDLMVIAKTYGFYGEIRMTGFVSQVTVLKEFEVEMMYSEELFIGLTPGYLFIF